MGRVSGPAHLTEVIDGSICSASSVATCCTCEHESSARDNDRARPRWRCDTHGGFARLLEEHVERLRAEGVADGDGDEDLHDLMKHREEPEDADLLREAAGVERAIV